MSLSNTGEKTKKEKPRNRDGKENAGSGKSAEKGRSRAEKGGFSAEGPDEGILLGRNAVGEALKNGRTIEKLRIAEGTGGSVVRLAAMAGERGIPVLYQDKAVLDRIAGGGRHQGIIAHATPFAYCGPGDILALAEARGEAPLILLLDGMEDPHNLGAILRSAEVFGAHGVILTKRRSAGVTEAAVRASAGAAEYMLCAKVSNLVQTMEMLKKEGLWLAACDMEGTPLKEASLEGGLGVVLGGEGSGISRLVRQRCDFSVSIPMKGKTGSLNASNAAAVILYEIASRREAAGRRG